LKVSH